MPTTKKPRITVVVTLDDGLEYIVAADTPRMLKAWTQLLTDYFTGPLSRLSGGEALRSDMHLLKQLGNECAVRHLKKSNRWRVELQFFTFVGNATADIQLEHSSLDTAVFRMLKRCAQRGRFIKSSSRGHAITS